jgi:peptidyl-prolyl cis-trans isomerase A (cyclophilin A)
MMRRLSFLFLVALGLAAGPAIAANPQVEFETTAGTIRMELYPDAAPKTVENFLTYVRAGHYTGTQFHRVIKGFMVQGGGFDSEFRQKPTRPPIEIEAEQSVKAGLSNVPGTVAMARTGNPNSATSQFFINVKDNPFLDQPNARDGNGYAVFAKVVSGMDVVDKIRAVPVGDKAGHQNVPATPVTIKKASLEK